MLQEVAMNDHRKLVAWQESMKLVEMVYTATRAFPRDEMFGLVAQMRRAAVSIPSNIAECAQQLSRVGRLIVGLRKSIKNKPSAGLTHA